MVSKKPPKDLKMPYPTSPSTVTTVASYTILPIIMPALPSLPTTTTHHLYLRPHEPKLPTEDTPRQLFLSNLPIDSTAAHFRQIFSSLLGVGRFESIEFSDERKKSAIPSPFPTYPNLPAKVAGKGNKKRKRGQEPDGEVELVSTLPALWDRTIHKPGTTAVVTLVDAKAVAALFKTLQKLHKKKEFPEWPSDASLEKLQARDAPSALGAARYATHLELIFPEQEEVQDAVDSYMTTYNQKEEEAKERAKRARNEPDADGFVMVTRGSRTAPANKEKAEEAARRMKEKEEKEREERQKVGFYKWQRREMNKKEVEAMQERFKENAREVAEMKAKKKLVPES